MLIAWFGRFFAALGSTSAIATALDDAEAQTAQSTLEYPRVWLEYPRVRLGYRRVPQSTLEYPRIPESIPEYG